MAHYACPNCGRPALRDHAAFPFRDGRSRNPGMGIRFVDLTIEQREMILALVRTFAYLDDAKPENCH